MKDNPAHLLEIPKVPKKLPNILTIQEIENILSAIPSTTPMGIRDLAIFELLYSCGLRVTELCDLKIAHILWVSIFVLVDGFINAQINRFGHSIVVKVMHWRWLSFRKYVRVFVWISPTSRSCVSTPYNFNAIATNLADFYISAGSLVTGGRLFAIYSFFNCL